MFKYIQTAMIESGSTYKLQKQMQNVVPDHSVENKL